MNVTVTEFVARFVFRTHTNLVAAGLTHGNAAAQEEPATTFHEVGAGLKIVEEVDNIGVCQTLLVCRKA